MEKKSQIRELLYELEGARREVMGNYFQQTGLTPGQPRVLKNLARQERLTQRELADVCRLDTTTLSRTLDRMEREGMILRLSKPDCRRSYEIVLTEKGREKAEQVLEGFQKLEHRLCQGLSDEDQEQLIGFLKIMKENMDSCTSNLQSKNQESS